MKDFIKNIMSKMKKTENDFFLTEKRWTNIYLSNRKSSFYKNIKDLLRQKELHEAHNLKHYSQPYFCLRNKYKEGY